MATGDIIAATVSGSAPYDGWMVSITIEGWAGKAGTITYDFGLTQPNGAIGNIASGASFAMTVVSKGFSAPSQVSSPSATTRSRTVYGTTVVKQAYPNHAVLDEADSGSDLVVKVALSDFVYADDDAAGSGTDPLLNVSAGWANDGSSDSNACTNLTVTNSSTKAYPKVKGCWLTPGGKRVGATFDGAVFAKHPYGVAGVEFILTDESANSVTHVATSPTSIASTRAPSTVPNVEAWQAAASTSTLTDEDGMLARFKVYPYIGDATSVLDSGASYGVGKDASKNYRIDKAGNYRTVYAYVDGTGGGTPAVSETAATARTTPFADMWNATKAIRDYINTNFSESNNVDGGVIRLMDSITDHVFGRTGFASTMTATYAYLVIEPDPLNSSTVRLRTKASSTQNLLCASLRFQNLKIEPAVQANFFASVGSADEYIFDSCTWYGDGATTTTYNSSVEMIWLHDCLYKDWAYAIPHFATLIEFQNLEAAVAVNAISVVGFSVDPASDYASGNLLQTSAAHTGGIVAYGRLASDAKPLLNMGHKPTNYYLGFITYERHTDPNEPAIAWTDIDSEDCFIEHVGCYGQRFNPQNQTAASNKTTDRFFVKHSAFAYVASKHDAFASDGTLTGGWSMHYGVGWENNYNGRADTFPFNFEGMHTFGYRTGTNTNPAVVDDQSYLGGDAGGGDYTPTSSSEIVGLVASGTATSSYDVNGRAIPDDGTGAAGAIQLAPAAGGVAARMMLLGVG